MNAGGLPCLDTGFFFVFRLVSQFGPVDYPHVSNRLAISFDIHTCDNNSIFVLD